MLSGLFYVSRATHPLSAAALQSLVGAAQFRNRRAHITGVLAFTGGHFAQALEGTSEQVEALLQKISIDTRHTRVRVLRQVTGQRHRLFADWSMQLITSPALDDALAALLARPDVDDGEVQVTLDRILVLARWNTADDVGLPRPGGSGPGPQGD